MVSVDVKHRVYLLQIGLYPLQERKTVNAGRLAEEYIVRIVFQSTGSADLSLNWVSFHSLKWNGSWRGSGVLKMLEPTSAGKRYFWHTSVSVVWRRFGHVVWKDYQVHAWWGLGWVGWGGGGGGGGGVGGGSTTLTRKARLVKKSACEPFFTSRNLRGRPRTRGTKERVLHLQQCTAVVLLCSYPNCSAAEFGHAAGNDCWFALLRLLILCYRQ